MKMQPPKVFSLSEVVRSTADELRRIHADEPSPDQAVMRFTECDIEVSVAVAADVDGKVKFWVIEAGAGVSYKNSQKVILRFSSIPGKEPVALVQDSGAAPLPHRPPSSSG